MSDSERPVPHATADVAPRAWHALDAQAAAEELGVSTAVGLTSAEAAARLAADGPNVLVTSRGPPSRADPRAGREPDGLPARRRGRRLAAAGKTFDAAVIALIVVANVIIGTLQEYRAEAALEALRAPLEPAGAGGA